MNLKAVIARLLFCLKKKTNLFIISSFPRLENYLIKHFTEVKLVFKNISLFGARTWREHKIKDWMIFLINAWILKNYCNGEGVLQKKTLMKTFEAPVSRIFVETSSLT